MQVAPHVGAWIETVDLHDGKGDKPSRPTWARGLKLAAHLNGVAVLEVAPHVGAWIETDLRA